MSIDSLVFASTQFSMPTRTWIILPFTANEMMACVSVRFLQETDGTFSLGTRGEFNEWNIYQGVGVGRVVKNTPE